MSSVSLINVTKKYNGYTAVDNLSLDVFGGELVCITGPAGCGKTTVLRLIAGLEDADSGELYLDGKPLGEVSVRERDVAMVSKERPVYKMSMSVYDNLAYGLRLRKTDEKEVDERVKDAAALLGISRLLNKKASSLSHGELMRVALCRGAVRRPKILLLDEPLYGLKGADRAQLMTEIISVQARLGSAVIMAASDSSDAMTLGKRVAVMKDGTLRQTETPKNLYENPADTFVATFIGEPQINIFEGRASRKDNAVVVKLGLGEVSMTLPPSRSRRIIGLSETESEVLVGVRAEDFHDEQFFIEASPDTVMEARVRLSERMGGKSLLYLDIDGKSDFAAAQADARTPLKAGDRVKLAVDANKILLFDKTTGRSLTAMPRRNLLKCKLLATKDGNLVARFGSNGVTLPEKVASRLIDRSIINGDAYLSISPSELYTEFKEGCDALDCEIDFVVKQTDCTVLYVRLSGIDEPKAVKAATDCPLSAGEKTTLWFNPEKTDVLSADFERLTAARAVTNNTATAVISVKNSEVQAVIGKNKLTLDSSKEWKNGACSLRLPPNAVGVVKKGGKNVITATLLDYDFTGKRTLMYLAADGFEPYFTAALSGAVACEAGKKIKLEIDTSRISDEKISSLSQYIREMAEVAPPYVYVESDDSDGL